MNRFAQYATLLEPHDLTFIAGTPYVYHCHHFNLFHDQTIDDVLGEEDGFRLRAGVAASAFAPLLSALFERAGAQTLPEKLELAQSLFASMGQGRLAVVADGGSLRGEGTHLHYGFAWRGKYGERIRRKDPVDSVAAGFIGALAEVALGDTSRRPIVERQCIAMRAPTCTFEPTADGRSERVAVPAEPELRKFIGKSEGGLFEDEIGAIAKGLQGFVKGVAGDERGLVDAFGVYVTQHLSGFYNETGFAAIRRLEAVSPGATESGESLLREAGHVCVFNTFGNILMSPEWEGMVGKLHGAPEEIVRGCTAIARGLGFGRWAIGEHEPGRRLVLRANANYEAAHWLARFGKSPHSRCYFMQGAALAFMVLATRVQWGDRPKLTQAFYEQLFRGKGLGFKLSTPRCLTMGNDVTEVVVEAT